MTDSESQIDKQSKNAVQAIEWLGTRHIPIDKIFITPSCVKIYLKHKPERDLKDSEVIQRIGRKTGGSVVVRAPLYGCEIIWQEMMQ